MSGSVLLQPAGIEKMWTELSQQRLAWAFRAYDRFIDSLSEDVRERFPKGDEQGEAYVVVFGKTQVGKTTLILDLMGLSDDGLKRVSNVLRGGREAGKSATATAMEYRRSSDYQWRFSSGAAKASKESILYDDKGMEGELANVRQQMFEKRLQADTPFTVWIPNDCFGEEKTAAFSVRMLDLPGDHAADAVERKHVQQMAQKYVPNADLILLVGKGDDLSFLKPASLELPSIEDWQIVPNRFRIVTTYSFTAQSVRNAMQQQKDVDAEFFRERLLDQIRTFGLKLEEEAADTKRFFPLEFGHSWVNAQQELVTKLKPVISSLKDELHGDIQSSATANVRLRNAVDVHVTVGKIKENRLKQMDEELRGIKERRNLVDQECKIAESALQDAQIQTDAIQKFLDALPYEKLKQQIHGGIIFDVETMLDKVASLGTNTSEFKSLINLFTSDLKSHFLSAQPAKPTKEEKKFWASVQPKLDQHVDNVEELIDEKFRSLRRKLSDYDWPEYYPRLSDNFSNDKHSMRSHMRNCSKSVGAWAAELWLDWARQRLDQLLDEVQSSGNHQISLQWALRERQHELAEINYEIKCAEYFRCQFVEKMKADEASSREFISLLEQAYLDELRERHRRINHAPTAAHAFVELLAADQLINERNKLINTLS